MFLGVLRLSNTIVCKRQKKTKDYLGSQLLLFRPVMDIANQLFSVTLGVEPNKQTLQSLAQHLSTAGT